MWRGQLGLSSKQDGTVCIVYIYMYIYMYVLVGGWAYPLEKWWSSSDWIIIPTIGENKIHVPNHQPVSIDILEENEYGMFNMIPILVFFLKCHELSLF